MLLKYMANSKDPMLYEQKPIYIWDSLHGDQNVQMNRITTDCKRRGC